ncbi:hypothetical protein [Plantactinospora sonchi]|uniref:Sensor domain-containing protein n=1 Tax=Plantactinospora sonchi TaxID=1544735 RepID=A0ABU7RYH2_9ACTN
MRRTPLQVPAMLTLGLIVLSGCTSNGDPDPVATDGPSTTASADTTGTASTGRPTGSPSLGTADTIPASALLQPEDLNGVRLEPVPEGDSAHLRPLRPCEARYPSDTTRTAAVAMRAYVSPGAGQTPQVILQYVGLHPGQAETAFDEISDAVRGCPGSLKAGQHRWEVAGTGVAGDESLLVRISERVTYGDTSVVTTPAVVARVGDHVTVVADLGWENSDGDESDVRRLATKAVERLRAQG